jgi:hypothetical protein
VPVADEFDDHLLGAQPELRGAQPGRE